MKESQKKEKRSIFVPIFLGLFMVLALGLGCLSIFEGIKLIVLKNISKNWPGAEGKMISTTIEEHWSSNRDGYRSASYGAVVKYTYTVNGQLLTNHRINYSGSSGGPKKDAQKIVARYPVGKEVTVYYNPKDPQKSVLEKGGSVKGIIICFMVGAVFLIIGGLLLLFVVIVIAPSRQKRKVIRPNEPDRSLG